MRKAIFVLASLFCFAACAHQQPIVKSVAPKLTQKEVTLEMLKYVAVEIGRCEAARAEIKKGTAKERVELEFKKEQFCAERMQNILAIIDGFMPSLKDEYYRAAELYRAFALLRRESHDVAATCLTQRDIDSAKECFESALLLDQAARIYRWKLEGFLRLNFYN